MSTTVAEKEPLPRQVAHESVDEVVIRFYGMV